ncbi:DUF268 domain-containing protein [Sphingomonas sp. 1P06PA]|uniref:DUF268 domain-containing protein n=1 Tax=Sphingomonas sp. 1P06PA TaxID=554121 RepID=UPI0039A44564
MSLKSILRPAYRIFTLFGLDPANLRHLRHVPRYVRDLRAFRRAGGQVDSYYPVLRDFTDSSGSATGHYFHQDLLVAQAIHAAAPDRHLDVASRVDGFVAHVAAFRSIDVLDIRPLSTSHPNIRFVQADLMQPRADLIAAYRSVSCLHALEHFGLGRYTDPIAPDGHRRGFDAIASIVAPGGVLYISVPVGRPRIEFNAQRVFNPVEPLAWAEGRFVLEQFDYVDDAGALVRHARPDMANDLEYGCGIYTLRHTG